MNWQDMIGEVVSKATGADAPKQDGAQEESGQAGGGLLGSVLGTAFSSLGGTGLTDKLNSVTSFLSPEAKANFIGSALNKVGASGGDVQALLQQLGINPAIADNPDEATPEELARLSEHLQQNGDDATEDASEEQEFSDEATDIQDQAEEQGDDAETADNSDEDEVGSDPEKDDEG